MALTESAGAAFASNAGNAVTSGSFTPTANGLLVACCSVGNGNNGTETSLAISDSVSGSWTQLSSAVTATGPSAKVYCKDAGASPSAQTVTFTANAALNEVGIVVRQFAGAAVAASQTGVTASTGSAAQASGSLSITPGTTGSQVVGAYGFSSSGTVMTANGNTTIYGQASSNCTVAEFEATSQSTGGTPVSVGVTQASGSNVIALAEILPAVAGSPPAASPMRPVLQAVRRAATY